MTSTKTRDEILRMAAAHNDGEVAIQRRAGEDWHPDAYTLEKLENEGLIKYVSGYTDEITGTTKIRYRITARGRAAVATS